MRRDLIVLTLAATLVGAGAEAQPLRGPGTPGQGGRAHLAPAHQGRAAIYDVRGRHGRGGALIGRDFRGRRFAAYGGTTFAGPLGVYGTNGVLEPGLVAEPYFKLPRPSELVPSAWGEGTYGIPTVSGIPPQPKADPVLYVINGGERQVGGARVISVQAPRR
ncbi:hypothetical protein [Methylobacterium sp. 17Sr1-1]|uniref:hypothetical protein n=1 Tax=Methylobacterium sp. 17Sr1-1 TaxID=2202826 RepID=UPI000D6FE35F|nr:hypothetical protein [Methylobacterium sp. 17Sr1-1]AWN54515.1 hypothetical protein DK412_25285 [Methylobacterium sp. 17Sr1-1]